MRIWPPNYQNVKPTMRPADLIRDIKERRKIPLSARICTKCQHQITGDRWGDEGHSFYCTVGDIDDELGFQRVIGEVDPVTMKVTINACGIPQNCPFQLEHFMHFESRKQRRKKMTFWQRILETLKNRRDKDYTPEKE